MNITDLYIVRHGHPRLGTGIAYDRVPGPPLSEIGQAEARLAGLFLATRSINALYVSPLERALGTGQAIAAEIGLPGRIEPALAEHRQEETFDDVKARLSEFLARLERADDPCVALVTHGSPIKAILHLLGGGRIDLSRHVYANGNHAPTAGVWHARRDSASWRLDLVFRPVVEIPPAHVPV